MPTSVVRGSINPRLQFEKLVTPVLGRTRLDTHTFAVSARRINKDFRQFFEGSSAVQKLPTFDVDGVFDILLGALLNISENTVSKTFSQNIRNLANSYNPPAADVNKVASFCAFISSRVQSSYSKIVNTNVGDVDYCYVRDFAAVEMQRFQSLHDKYSLLARNSSSSLISGFDPHVFADFLYDVMLPYFGESSVLEMLGYPCFKKFGLIIDRHVSLWTAAISYHLDHSSLSLGNLFSSIYSNIPSFYSFVPLRTDVQYFTYQPYTPINVSEDFIRVAYAAWYDGLRNWHVEERSHLLDPDSWDSTSIFPASSQALADFNSQRNYVATCFALLHPHYCCYSRDFYTTVQTDDIFRYVFSPSSSVEDNSTMGILDVESITDNKDFQQLVSITVGGLGQSMFPSGLFKNSGNENDLINFMAQDLQTMRRSGMLEKWLARNYFYPDTYAGQIMAHYGTRPSDFTVISAEYIGGSESMMTGDQAVTATGTEDTPAGTRTLVANASTKDEFSYSSNGDFTYLVSFVSIVPLVTYDCKNLHLHEISRGDMPFPEFANDTRIGITANDMFRELIGIPSQNTIMGYVPRYYGYRNRGDEAHGRYLTDYRSYLWLHDYYSSSHSGFAYVNNAPLSVFGLSAYEQHVHLPLDAFLGLQNWDSIAFGDCDIVCEVECPLPAAIEFI